MSPPGWAAPPRVHEDGFTLAELLVVLAIMGVLGAIAVLVVPLFAQKADTSACESDRRTIQRAIDSYEGGRPGSLSALGDEVDQDAVSGDDFVRRTYTLTYRNGSLSSCQEAMATGGGTTGRPTVALSVLSRSDNGRPGNAFRWGGVLRVSVAAHDGAPITSAVVSGGWSYPNRGANQNAVGSPPTSCTTGAGGTCTLTYPSDADGMGPNVPTARFTVSAVAGTSPTYVPPTPATGIDMDKP